LIQVSVIIVNYNVRYFLEQCIYSLQKAGEGRQVEVIVIDNQSSDGSLGYLQPKFPGVTFIPSEYNAGFAKACNKGANQARGRYILFLNPDTLLPEDCLQRCLLFFEAHASAGALGVKMIDGSGKFLKESKRSFPSPLTALYKLSGLAWLFPQSPVFSRYYLGHLDENKNHKVDVLAGAFMMIRREVLEITGGFDEDFFMYGEDIDLSYRIQKAGYDNYYLAETRIIHFKGESTKTGSLNYVRMFYGAMSIFVRKHYGGRRAGLFRASLHMAIWIRAFLSAMAKLVRRIGKTGIPKKPVTKDSKPYLLIAATQREFEQVKSLLQRKNLHHSIIGRIAVDEDTDHSVAGLNDTDAAAQSLGATELILCAGTLTYRQIISFIQTLTTTLQIRFHRVGSGSMVGSDYGETVDVT
jgi:GT2 family glycosyltransferase